jgi:hypothetical protein
MNTFTAARLLLTMYGDDAAEVATQRGEQSRIRGNTAAATTWQTILTALEELQSLPPAALRH